MSLLLEQFEQAVRRKDWKTAYKHCNGLNMYEMLRGLDSLSPNDLEKLRAGLTVENKSGDTYTPRIAFAINVVMSGEIGFAPGDLKKSGQVKDAEDFLKEKEKKATRQGPRFGYDGQIPANYRDKLNYAFNKLWQLNDKPDFTEKFRLAIEKSTNKPVDSSIYESALNNLVVHLADTTKNPKALDPMTFDNEEQAKGHGDVVGMAYTRVDEPNVWIRQSSLDKDINTIIAILIHELTHTKGTTDWFPALIDEVNNAAGYPRPTIKK